MSKGVKKIKWNSSEPGGAGAYSKQSIPNRLLTIEPDKFAWFSVNEWYPETTKSEKEKNLTWIRQDRQEKTILNQMTIPSNKLYGFRVEKKLCGPFTYYIEASLSGKRDFKNETGLYVRGYCTPKIIDSKWSTSNDGKDERSRQFSYGEKLYLGVNTEGLNGNILTVEIFRLIEGSRLTGRKEDKHIRTIANVLVIDGEINLEINNTSLWKADIIDIQQTEKFYIKIKDAFGNYIKDDKNDIVHARYLRIKNESVPQTPKKPTNNTPVKVGQNQVNKKRDELCKFSAISITETQKKDGKTESTKVEVFKEGQALKGNKAPQELVTRTIFFDFDQHALTSKSVEALDNVLNFLLSNPYSIITIDGYACIIGKSQYNKDLSLKRSEAVRKHFINGGLDSKRIRCIGRGEIQLNDGKIVGQETDEKRKGDDITHKDEKNYLEARRVDISFVFTGHDAQTIVYEVVAPSSEKKIAFEAIDYETKACISQKKHAKQIKVLSAEYKEKEGKKSTSGKIDIPVHSSLAWGNIAPAQYIWPKYNLLNWTAGKNLDSGLLYNVYINSCRYFSNEKNATVLIKAYPDIKWDLKFFLNLTNDLSVKWQNQPSNKIKELQQKAGKLGAERRWKQKEASFGFSLKGDWDMNDSGQYNRSKEFKAEYETKFKKMYDLFSSLGAMSDGITNKTKGQIRNIGFKGMPMTFVVKPPNLNLNGVWSLERAKVKESSIEKVGTKVDISFNADPLIGLEITIDLLCTAVGLVAGAVSGGTAAPGAVRLYGLIKGKMNDGVGVGNDDFGAKVSSDVYIDLIISSVIKTALGFSFNTESDSTDSQAKVETKCTLKVELKAGVWIKGEANLIVVKAEAYFEMSGKGSASITFGHGVKYDSKGLMYRPELGFDGLNAEYVIKGKVGLSSKKKVLGAKAESSDEGIIKQGTFNEIVPKFDVVKSLEELFGISADIPIIKS